MAMSFRSETTEALRACADRLCQLAMEHRVDELHAARREFQRALESLSTEADSLQLERDDAHAEAMCAERNLTAARQILEDDPDGHVGTARMLESERVAREDAESARTGLALQAAVGSVLAESLDYRAALARAAELIVPTAADVFLADLLAGSGLEQATVACTDSQHTERLRARRLPDPASDHPIAEVIRTGKPLLMTEIEPAWLERWAGGGEALELWEGLGLTTLAIVPIRSHRQIHGALTFAFGPSGRRHSDASLRVLQDIGARTALALDTAQLFGALQASQRHREEFLAMLAHELRNPLAAVSSGLAALERVDPAARVQLLQILGRQSRHLARLLNDLLDVSGARFGRVALERRRLDLRELASQVLQLFQAPGKAGSRSIDFRPDPNPVVVIGDADRLEQVIANLLDNAIKYTPLDGSIELSVAADGDEGVIRVRDSGVGVEPEFLPRIFEVFSRGAGELGSSSPGLGLGLSVVRDLVAKHGGTVSASSAGPGRGSEFTVRLPLETGR